MRMQWLFSVALIGLGFNARANDWYCPNGKIAFKPYSCIRNFYVDGGDGRDSNPGSEGAPWATIQQAGNSGVLKAGDCVNVAAGTYRQNGSGYNGLSFAKGGSSNSPTGYVSYISAPNHASKIVGNASLINLINVLAPYIILDGFEVDATSIPGTAVSDVSPTGHHLMLLNNKIHDAGGGGIAFNNTDYLTVVGNEVFNNAFTNPGRMSGISVYNPAMASGFTTTSMDNAQFHIVIRNNVVWGNSTKNVCLGKPAGCLHSDGNGIIADNWLGSAYPFSGLIQSNLMFNNGGPGFQSYLSANVTVANNTAYNNNLDIGLINQARGELSAQGSNHISFFNNIMYAFPNSNSAILKYNTAMVEGQLVWMVSDYSAIIWSHNITFNGTPGQPSTNFQTPTASSDLNSFRANNQAGVWPKLTPYAPATGSPAIGTGLATLAPTSLCGAPAATPPNVGAY